MTPVRLRIRRGKPVSSSKAAIIRLMPEAVYPSFSETGGQWMALAGLALVCTAFGFTMQPVAQKPLSSETTGIICALNPLTTAVLGRLLLGENFGAAGIWGAVLILTGIVLPNVKLPGFSSEKAGQGQERAQ